MEQSPAVPLPVSQYTPEVFFPKQKQLHETTVDTLKTVYKKQAQVKACVVQTNAFRYEIPAQQSTMGNAKRRKQLARRRLEKIDNYVADTNQSSKGLKNYPNPSPDQKRNSSLEDKRTSPVRE